MIPGIPDHSRRRFLMRAGGGIGGLALTRLLGADGLLAGADAGGQVRTHHRPRAKNCIYIYLEVEEEAGGRHERKPFFSAGDRQLVGMVAPQSLELRWRGRAPEAELEPGP